MNPLSSYDLLQRMAMYGERRQQVLAENIANIDTPNYKTRDLDAVGFQFAMREAVRQNRNPQELTSEELFTGPGDPFSDEVFQARPTGGGITFQDGNNRSIEREITELTKNLLMQNFAVQLMSAQSNTLEAVISGRS